MINVGVIGIGQWGTNYIRIFNELDDTQLKWCCDINKQRLQRVNKIYPHIITTQNYSDILSDKETTAVCVSTPATTHHRIVKDCLLAGKDVLVEKPLTISSKDAEDLVKLAEKERRILMVGHVFLYNPAIEKLKELIMNDELGDIHYLYATRTGLGPIRSDTSAMWDLAPHDISIFCYIMNKKPISVNAIGLSRLRKNIEDVVFLTLRFPEDIIGHIHVSWFDPKKVRKITVVGKNKMAVFDDMEPAEKLKIITATLPDERFHLTYDDFLNTIRYGDVSIPKIDLTEPLKLETLHFLDCINTRKTPKTDGLNGLLVAKILDTAQKSLEKDGIKVEINCD